MKKGRRFNTANLLVFVNANQIAKRRLGLIVSKQVGNAVVRNKWKRKIRECFRVKKHAWGTACDIVVMVRAKNKEAPPLHVMEAELNRAVLKLTEA